MNPAVRAAVEIALGARVERVSALSGGDINDAYRADLAGGRAVFVKTNSTADPAMFPAEARGLELLREAGAIRIPEVLAVSSGERDAPCFLVLEYLEPGRRMRDFEATLGRGFAALHRASMPVHGLEGDNFIARLPQSNRAHPRWADFFRAERLEPQMALAARAGLATARMKRDAERLYARLDALVGPEEPPARLHGDLWSGNLHVGDGGEPCLIDPAVYGGHREVDLAMMRLFGGFTERTFAAYDEAYPLAPGHEERVPLYQLYPLLVHVNLFGGGYVSSVERILSTLA